MRALSSEFLTVGPNGEGQFYDCFRIAMAGVAVTTPLEAYALMNEGSNFYDDVSLSQTSLILQSFDYKPDANGTFVRTVVWPEDRQNALLRARNLRENFLKEV